MTKSDLFFPDVQLARRLAATDASVGVEAAKIHAQLHPESGATAEPFGGGVDDFSRG